MTDCIKKSHYFQFSRMLTDLVLDEGFKNRNENAHYSSKAELNNFLPAVYRKLALSVSFCERKVNFSALAR